MMTSTAQPGAPSKTMSDPKPGRIVRDEKPVPEIAPLEALVRITATTICGTEIHILKGNIRSSASLLST